MESQVNSAIIIDNGSDTCRAGFSHEDEPRVVLPSFVTYYTPQGKQKLHQEQQLLDTVEKSACFGDEAPPQTEELKVCYPLNCGFVEDWDGMEDIWRHILRNKLEVKASEHNVLLSEKVFTPKRDRQKTTELMFEAFSVGGFYLSKDAELVMHANGILTGVCVDIGHTSSYVVPVYEGYWLPSEVLSFNVTGKGLTKYLYELIQEKRSCSSGISNSNSDIICNNNSSNSKNCSSRHSIISETRLEHIRKVKEQFCYVAFDYDDELRSSRISFDLDRSYYLPSGEVITINSERFKCAEPLFKPCLLEEGGNRSLPETINQTIMMCDLDIRKDLYRNIVLAGQSRFLPGLHDRLSKEITWCAMNGVQARVVHLKHEHLSYKGGCVFANVGLDGLVRKWISQEDYDEYGPEVVNKMCF